MLPAQQLHSHPAEMNRVNITEQVSVQMEIKTHTWTSLGMLSVILACVRVIAKGEYMVAHLFLKGGTSRTLGLLNSQPCLSAQ